VRECMGEPHVGERRHKGEQQGGEQPGHRHVGNFSGSSDINTSLADLNVSRRAPSPIRNERCLSPLWPKSPTMQTPQLHEDIRARSVRWPSQRNTTLRCPQDTSALLAESQNHAALVQAIELIELRYEEHRARMELEALFAEGRMGCL